MYLSFMTILIEFKCQCPVVQINYIYLCALEKKKKKKKKSISFTLLSFGSHMKDNALYHYSGDDG